MVLFIRVLWLSLFITKFLVTDQLIFTFLGIPKMKFQLYFFFIKKIYDSCLKEL